MYQIKHQNIGSSKIAVTATATALYSLVDTAGSVTTSQAYFGARGANAVIVNPEDGDIRVLNGVAPTSTQGFLCKNGSKYVFTGTDLSDLRMIRTGGANVAVSIILGKAEAGESFSGVADTVSLTLDEFPAATAAADNFANPTTTDVKSFGMLWDSATWDRAPGNSAGGAYSQGAVAHDASDSGNPVKIGGKAQNPTALPAAVAANDRADYMTDLYGRSVVYLGTTLDPTNDKVGTTPRDHSGVNTTALAASLVIKNAAGKLFRVKGHNDNAAAQYIQIHDAASLPADTAIPEDVKIVAGDSNVDFDFQGKSFSTGIVVCNSSTLATKTIGAADCWFSAEYE